MIHFTPRYGQLARVPSRVPGQLYRSRSRTAPSWIAPRLRHLVSLALAVTGFAMGGAAAGVLPAADASEPHRVAPCHIRGARVLFRDAVVAVVVGHPIPELEGPIPGTYRRAYSCARGGGRPHYLFSIGYVGEDDTWSIDHVVLAGRYGAFHVNSGSVESDVFQNIEVVNLAAGRVVAQETPSPSFPDVLSALVLDAAGTAAWTYTLSPGIVTVPPVLPGESRVVLWAASVKHRIVELDSGPVQPRSLTVLRTVVHWTDADVPLQFDLGAN
jgi:hypothetical protein